MSERLPSTDSKLMLWCALCFLIGMAGVAVAVVGTVPVSDGVSLQAPDGMNATLTGSTDSQLEEPFPTSGTVEWTTEAGNVSFFSSGAANATIHKDDIEGTWTNVSSIDADPDTITIEPEDKDSAVVGQEIDTFAWRDGIEANDSTVDFSYTASGNARVTVQGLSVSGTTYAIDADTGTILDSADASSGSVTYDGLDDGDHDVTIQTDVNDDPTLSNPSATGDLTTPPSEVSIDVSDPNFPQGDSVDVTIDVDGSQVHSETVSSNQTVTASVPSSATEGGSHSWSVDASDEYGGSTSESYNYAVPDELRIFNESSPSDVIDDVDTELQFYQGDEVFTRNTSNGTINLTDLPVSGEMVVRAEADGYFPRRTYLHSIFEQQAIYLLPENASTSQVVFTLDDQTGNFPSGETVLQIQRPLTKDFNGDGNETTEWRTIAGDYFGASGSFPAELETGQRYRLTVQNDDGDERALGSYTVTGDAAESLPIGQVSFGESEDGTPVMQGALQEHDGERYVRVTYNDPSASTTELEYRIVRTDNNSIVLQDNTTVTGPLNTYAETVEVPSSAPDDVGYTIEYTADRSDGESVSDVVYVGDTPNFLTNLGLDPTVAAYIAFVGLAALVGLVVIYDDRLAAITGVVGASALSMGGIISINPVALGVAGTIAVIYTIARIR